MIKLNFITSLSAVNVIKRTFATKFTAGDDSLPLPPDHEKVTKRIASVASGRFFREQELKQESRIKVV